MTHFETQKIGILVVDDTPANLSVLTQMLSRKDYEIRVAPNGKLALQSAQSKPPQLILLDITMPGLNGYQVCEQLKANPKTSDIPIIFISALDGADNKVKAFQTGGVDYITKPFETVEVLARIDNQLRLRSLQLQLQQQNQQLQQEIESRQAVEEHLRILKRAIAESVNGIIIIEARIENYPIIFVNTGFERITGYSSDEVLGQEFDFLLDSDRESEDFQKLKEAIATGKSCQILLHDTRKDKTRFWNELSLSPVRDKKGNLTHFIGIQNDVSHRISIEEKIIRAKEIADEANQAKSTFIANMSHELRSPLNAILGFSQLMARSQGLSQSDRENIGIINRSGEHLLTLINNILDLSKIEAGKTVLQPVNFDFYRLLDEVEDMFLLRAENKGLKLIFERQEQIPQYVCTDIVKLRQILINLLGNAIKFTHVGGISVRVRKGKEENETKTETHYQFPITQIHFDVIDTGVGIAESELDRLFEAFAQTQAGAETQEGTGLGLPIAQKFARLMGGDIRVHSVEGKGSTFSFDIWVGAALAMEVLEAKPKHQVIALANHQIQYRVLVVDDRPSNRILLVKLLQPLGFAVKEAENGKRAIEIWETWEPHLIWMDMRMPVMDGYEATKYIKRTIKGNATAVIALTASALEEEKAIVLSAGCDDFVRKPFREEELFETMAKHLGVRYVYDDTDRQTQHKKQNHILDSGGLGVMPEPWRKQLYQAAIDLDDEQILTLVAEIPEDYANLAKAIANLVNQFRIDKIIELIEQI
ncbi:response regulator [Spirulina sp. 06S082]|uniref:response regulator n=1 Tax=Spirulina sp. 06S082 TaxID=3110248 RepID=UPI002B20DD7A|nr:response regulator [Spirulina sp. 06S082]MEA5467622.1 response regulator [Spirulina sp. 06S082]